MTLLRPAVMEYAVRSRRKSRSWVRLPSGKESLNLSHTSVQFDKLMEILWSSSQGIDCRHDAPSAAPPSGKAVNDRVHPAPNGCDTFMHESTIWEQYILHLFEHYFRHMPSSRCSDEIGQNKKGSPVSGDLNLGSMCAKELNVRIWVFEQGDDQAPCLWAFLNVKEILLEALLVTGRCLGILWCIG
jgi:hypothetical protein